MSSLIKRRGRTVSFRVSDEEYLSLCQATDASGAHSISDYARHVTCHHSLVVSRGSAAGTSLANGNGHFINASEHPSAPAMVLELNRLREQVDQLTRQMQQVLARRVSSAV